MQRKQEDWKQRVWIREVHEPILLGGTIDKLDIKNVWDFYIKKLMEKN